MLTLISDYLIVLPGTGLLALVWMVGAWAIVFGASIPGSLVAATASTRPGASRPPRADRRG